jgi:hypothetical protein
MVGLSLGAASGRVFAGPWSTQPLVGVAAEYASNPPLVAANSKSEANAALYLDLPVNYDLDTAHFAVTPRVRYSDTQGYSSVTSNYWHLDASAKFIEERDTTTVSGALYQDSSLLYAGEVSNGIGVRRDTASVDANWQHALTERVQFQLDGNAVRTRYGQSAESTNLVNYSDAGVSPAVSYALSELTTVRLLGGVSRYKSLNGFTASNTTDLELGLDRHINELWTVSASAGYSKSTNQYNFGFVTLDTAQNGAVYSLNLTRQTETLTATASASRALTPTGFAFLTRQDTFAGLLNYIYTERLSFGAGATWASIAQPLLTGGNTTRRFYNVDLSGTWHWTEQWVFSMHVNKIEQQYSAQPNQPAVSPSSSGVSVQLARQFYRTNQ